MQHDLVFGVDDEYRKIYRADLIRQKSLSTFSYVNPVYGREVEGTTVSPADSAQTDCCAAIRCFCRTRFTSMTSGFWSPAGAFRVRPVRRQRRAVQGQHRQQRAEVRAARRSGVSLHRRVVVLRQLHRIVQTQLDHRPAERQQHRARRQHCAGRSQVVGAGAKLDMPGRITGNIALFDIKKRNVLVANSEGPTTIYSAAGEVRSRGLELDLTGQLTTAGA
jgi:iron complex outermembrane receptor protein